MDVYEEVALRAANEARSAAEAEAADMLCRGVSGERGECPVNRTVLAGSSGLSCATSEAEIELWFGMNFGSPDSAVSLPAPAREFVRRFDAGAYPRLLDESEAA